MPEASCKCARSELGEPSVVTGVQPTVAHDKGWAPAWRPVDCAQRFVTVDGWLAFAEVRVTVRGGFGLGGPCKVLVNLGGGVIRALAFWKSARLAKERDCISDLRREYGFYTKSKVHEAMGLHVPKFYGMARVPPGAADQVACGYALVLEHLTPFQDFFGNSRRATNGFVVRGHTGGCCEFVCGLFEALDACHHAGSVHGDLKIANTLLRYHTPGQAFTERKSGAGAGRVYEALWSGFHVVLCDWGSFRGAGEAFRGGGTRLYRSTDWWGEHTPTCAYATDKFAAVMMVLCVLAGSELRLSRVERSVALDFGKAYSESKCGGWVRWWFSEKALEFARKQQVGRLLIFITSLRRRAGECEGVHEALDDYLSRRANNRTSMRTRLQSDELWRQFAPLQL
jgi:hypothetical protein